MLQFFRRYKAITALALSFCMLFVFIGDTFAENKTEDGIVVLKNDSKVIEVKGTHKGDELYGTYDKATQKITLKAVEKANSPIGFSSLLTSNTNKEVEYDVNLLEANEASFEATLTEKKTKKEHKIKENGFKIELNDKVKAQLPLIAPVAGILGRAVIERLLGLALAITINGVTWVVASEMADSIRNREEFYYAAKIIQQKVVISGSIDYSTAYTRIRTGEDVFCKNQYLAREITRIAGNGLTPGTDPDGETHGDGSDGYYHHYHPLAPLYGRAHVFFFNY
ncbi:hypothetical protein C8Z91_16900 [Paenibacillus elgii]|uniref:Uncharacterized protein n=1 Tax=Paenibacillus elgii TaxID=189691 RepID=A0A2T6G1P3_9BACL|nr:hypothetical protein [Paenibacillus elgii]PUA38074.1 hypothetical protein C8Z91_16900 [Paenibacillus elgii]